MKVRIGGKVEELRAVWLENGRVRMIDQRALPFHLTLLDCPDVESVAAAIESMAVRGAPAIGIAAAYGLGLAKTGAAGLEAAAERLRRTRPTGRDLFHALETVAQQISAGSDPGAAAEAYARDIEDRCRRIGVVGGSLVKVGARVLTHCNAGALATGDHGTATAPIRVANDEGRRPFVWVSETRPRLQGARLTAWELSQEGIEHAIIADSASGHLMQHGQVDLVIVGADRIAADGSFANKIGTYEKAVVAREHAVPFYVAAPLSTFDFTAKGGADIPVEERSEDEVTVLDGRRIANPGSRAVNPAFDVTPPKFVTAFITEKGLIRPEDVRALQGRG